MSKAGEVYNVPRGTAYLTTQQIITYTTYLIFYVALARILDQTRSVKSPCFLPPKPHLSLSHN